MPAAPVPVLASGDAGEKQRLAGRKTASRWLGLAAALVAGVWLAQRRATEQTSPVAPPSHRGSAESPASAGGDRGQAPRPERPSVPASPDHAVLLLRSGHLRSGGSLPRLTVPAPPLVRIEAELDAPSSAEEYEAVLQTAEGNQVWRGRGRRRPGANRVVVVVPTKTLKPGDYILGIQEPGRPPAEAAEYPFDVRVGTGPTRRSP